MTRVLIAGGGPAAVEAVLTLRELAPDAEVELLAPDDELVLRPLSVVEPFRTGQRRYPLSALGVPINRSRLVEVVPQDRVAVTASGERLAYDALLVATGVAQRPPVPHAITFRGDLDVAAMEGLVQDVEESYSRSVAFFAAAETAWTLPLYELALQTAERARAMGADDLRLTITTGEQEPLELLGAAATDLVGGLLGEAGITFATGAAPPAGAARLVCLGVHEPPAIPGLPPGFLRTDERGAVEGVECVWAAGDVTDRPLRQGGLATQQAAVAAAAIAGYEEDLDAPVLRAMLIAGRRAAFFRRRLDGIDPGHASERALWWPPSKLAGQRLSPFLDQLDAGAGTLAIERKLTDEPAKRRLIIAADGRGLLG